MTPHLLRRIAPALGLALGLGSSPLGAEPTREADPRDLARRLNQAFVAVADEVSPSVVVLSVTRSLEGGEAGAEGEGPSFWDWLPREFRRRLEEPRGGSELPPGHPRTVTGQGSGVIFREDGFILTNGHVVEDAERVRVRLHDGRQFEAEVRGVDPLSDLAVLKVDARGLPAARFADSDRVRVGEWAIAIGAPFELDYSVTFGHVSAKGRSHLLPDPVMDQDFIQTDAQINPGNSGGPLVNIEGEVIGINTLIRGLRTGIGFAIPSNLAREVAEKIAAEGRFTRAWLGVRIAALADTPALRRQYPDLRDGVVVQGLVPDGPAAQSRLRVGDVITAVEGRPVATAQQLRHAVRTRKTGSTLVLDVIRDGQPLQVEVRPEPWPETTQVTPAPRPAPTSPAETTTRGMTLRVLTPELARELDLTDTEGLVVTAVEPGSPAAAAGVQRGDLLTAINHHPVTTLRDVRAMLRRLPADTEVVLHLHRGGHCHNVSLKEAPE